MATAYIKPPPGLEDLVEQKGEVLSLSALIPKDSRADRVGKTLHGF